MTYGTIKVDTITFTDNGSDVSVSVSGLTKNPTISGNLTVTGNISGTVIEGGITVVGATVTGTTANFVSGVYTTQVSGATITGDAGQFTTLTGGTAGFTLLHLADAGNITVGTTTGTKIGTATTQKLGFYNATPVVQPTALPDANALTIVSAFNALLSRLRALGLIAT